MNLSKRAFMRLLALGAALLPGFTIGSSRAAVQASAPSRPRLLQGPMLGAVSPTSALIWIRASDEYDVTVEYGATSDFANSQHSRAVRTSAENYYAATLSIDSLEANTNYFYRILLDGTPPAYAQNISSTYFTTAPAPGASAQFTVGTGSCARFAEDPHQLIWNTVNARNPDFFVWLGDNIYGDTARADVLSAEYQRQRDVGTFAPIAPRIPQLAIWDDHDYGVNNGGRRNPIKTEALRVFKNFWANPSHGLPDAPGIFFHYQYGGVDFFFLDVRYYRDPNSEPDYAGKTMLGDRQKDWLKSGLKASTAAFKVLVSGSAWSKAKGPGGDSWSSFMSERNEILNYIRDEKIGGVVLVSGDTHVAELNAIPWSEKGGYDFYDLTSSPLAQDTSTSWLERRPERRIRQVYFGSVNFGLLTFDMRTADPALQYNVVNYIGDNVWQPFHIKASELINGVASWEEKMDDLSRLRYESEESGGEYYKALPHFES